MSISYQWQNDVSGSYQDISGATSQTYVPVTSEASHNVRVVVTDSISGTVLTSSSVVIKPAPPTQVVIQGTAQVGQTLTAVVS